jgi:Transposase zinc-ribbon domain
MAKNKIQFQQGLSLLEFLTQYGSEKQCRQSLFQWRWPHGFICPECGHDKYCTFFFLFTVVLSGFFP